MLLFPLVIIRRVAFALLCTVLFLFILNPAVFGQARKTAPLFRLLNPAQTGISFKNTITENDKLNILNEAYIYNGGGVGIGDFNNDGMADIYCAANMVSNKLYLNKGKLQFQDVTAVSGTSGGGKWCTGVSVVDINSDGWLDIYVAATFHKDSLKRTNLLYINQGLNKQGVPTFKESARAYGIADNGYSTQGYFFDYDKDGDLDLFVLTNSLDDPRTPIQFRPKLADGTAMNTDRLYRNNGNGTFTDVSKAAGILMEGWGHAASISDINLDGWPDIYVSNDFVSNDICYINNGDGTFTDRITDYFKHTSWYTMGTNIADINNDGFVDLIGLDMLPETNLRKKGMMMGNEYYNYFNSRKFNYQHQYVRNVLQLNTGLTPTGQPAFSDIGIMAGVYETDWSWTPLVADFDNDGFRDLIITNGLPRDVTDLDYITYDNGQGGGKVNTSLKMVDALPVVKISNYAYRNTGGFMFENTTNAWGLDHPSFANGAAYADLDNDGDLDLVINNINEVASVYENTLYSNQGKGNIHHLFLNLNGGGANPQGIGAVVHIYYGGKQQYYEHQPTRGYLSTVEAKAHFGLGNIAVVDSVVVRWPDGKINKLANVQTDQVISINHKDAGAEPTAPATQLVSSLFREVGKSTGIQLRHREKDAVDYNIQPTIPHKLSQFGPGMAVGDVDGNGLEDLYVAGSAGNAGMFLLQKSDGKFTLDSTRIALDEIASREEMGVLLFDADNDNDLDLYVASGSYEFSPNNRGNQDRLYINDGKGVFQWDRIAVPTETVNGSCVRAADFDQDGDLDLFVGGRSTSGAYPLAPRSFIYLNEGGRFLDVTKQWCPQLQFMGMITDALWSDFDGDGKTDLVLTGEWMPVSFLKNIGNSFVPATTGVEAKTGWWNSLTSGDFDKDGDIDYVAGNLGLNSTFKGTEAEPILLYANDLDQNGKLDPMVFCYMKAENGQRKPFPMHTKDDLSSQLVSIRKSFPTYKSFGFASAEELWPKQDRENAIALRANHMASSYLENKGNGRFEIRALPLEAQTAPVFGMLSTDVDLDGNLDLLLVGNDYGMEPGSGRHDAFNGLVLKGNGKGGFSPLTIAQSGFYVKGDGKALTLVTTATGNPIFVASQNQDSLLTFAPARQGIIEAFRLLALQPDDFGAEIIYKDGSRRKMEFYYGSGFLSQSSRKLVLEEQVAKIIITNYKGVKREIPGPAGAR